ncbi:hypothetical protein Y032_0014g2431 [Ancylostoma ceylanicum]|uniref:Uncharacterized protein n=1 Tax=Ancylostoma ceylanicum TaxID=53326 RepID=A0A016V9F1_9BILA|nr:hypothetical protein Y032_0014g2431 [Ancylostoma ceylanicum]
MRITMKSDTQIRDGDVECWQAWLPLDPRPLWRPRRRGFTVLLSPNTAPEKGKGSAESLDKDKKESKESNVVEKEKEKKVEPKEQKNAVKPAQRTKTRSKEKNSKESAEEKPSNEKKSSEEKKDENKSKEKVQVKEKPQTKRSEDTGSGPKRKRLREARTQCPEKSLTEEMNSALRSQAKHDRENERKKKEKSEEATKPKIDSKEAKTQ